MFSYPSELIEELDKKLPDDENMLPYGYRSMEEYMQRMEEYAARFFTLESDKQLFVEFKTLMEEMNRKEDWSIARYIGKSDDNLFGPPTIS